MASRQRPATFAQRFVKTGVGHLPCGHEPKHNAGKYRDREGKEQDGGIEPDFFGSGQALRNQHKRRTGAPMSKQQAEPAPSYSQEHAFGEQLADDSSRRSAEGDPHRELALPSARTSKQKIGDVDASDQEDERNGAKENRSEERRVGK